MANMKWFKFYGQDFLTDPKMMNFSSAEKMVWIVILSLANASDEQGIIRHTNVQSLVSLTGINAFNEDEWNETMKVLEKFERYEMITTVTSSDNDSNVDITVTNFNKRQNENLSNAERQKRYRKSLKNEAKTIRNDSNITSRNYSNARLDKNRVDKNKEKSIEKKAPSLEDLTQEVIEKIALDYKLPLAFVVSKADDLRNWCASKGKTFKDYPAALRNWVKKDAEKIVQAQRLPSKSFDAASVLEGGQHAIASP